MKIIINGFRGKLGRAIHNRAEQAENFTIAAGIDAFSDGGGYSFKTFKNIGDCNESADVIVDCSVADAVPSVVEFAVSKKMPVVICTTGLSKETLELINQASKKIPVFRSANMSLGINLLADLLEKAVGVLNNSDFDIEIIEKHHNLKLDAPSGTALLLADVINNAAGNSYEYIYDRSQKKQKRDKREIGIHAVRGGTIVGEHSVIFAGTDEVIEINHSAYSKEVFASGALRACEYICSKVPGLYDMRMLVRES